MADVSQEWFAFPQSHFKAGVGTNMCGDIFCSVQKTKQCIDRMQNCKEGDNIGQTLQFYRISLSLDKGRSDWMPN